MVRRNKDTQRLTKKRQLEATMRSAVDPAAVGPEAARRVAISDRACTVTVCVRFLIRARRSRFTRADAMASARNAALAGGLVGQTGSRRVGKEVFMVCSGVATLPRSYIGSASARHPEARAGDRRNRSAAGDGAALHHSTRSPATTCASSA